MTTTVPAAEVRAAAELVRQVTERLAVARRPASQLPALDDVATGRRVFSPVDRRGQRAGPAAGRPPAPATGVVGEATLGVAYEGPPGFVHGGMSALLMDQVLGAAAAAAGLWGMTAHLELDYRGAAAAGDDAGAARPGWPRTTGRKSRHHRHHRRWPTTPDQVLVEARGVFVLPRPEKVEAYFGAITDATGRHTPPEPADATRPRSTRTDAGDPTSTVAGRAAPGRRRRAAGAARRRA